MKAFKYLVFFILSIPTFVQAAEQCTYTSSGNIPPQTFNSLSALCSYIHQASGRPSSGYDCRSEGNRIYLYIKGTNNSLGQFGSKQCQQIQCPSATSKDLKVPINSKSYVCVQGCQYRLRACVDVDMEPGMTCSAISTGQDCGTNPPPQTPDPNKPPADPATPDPADPNGPPSKNTAQSESTSTSTSQSTSTSSTDSGGNTINNTTTTTTTNTTTNTIINLDRLENIMQNLTSVITSKLDAILGKMDQDGGSEGGTGEGTDLTETNAKLDENNSLLSDLKDWLTGEGDGSNGSGGDNPFGNDAVPQKQLTEQTFQTNLFTGSAACPADRTLSFTLFTGKSFSKTFSFAMWCDKLQIFGYFILIASYFYGALIITRNS